MKVRVLQLKSIGSSAYGFMDWEFTQEHRFTLDDYKVVWEGDVDLNIDLDDIFRMFNIVTQEDVERLDEINYKGHSLSVSDIVELNGELFYCDTFGWAKIK